VVIVSRRMGGSSSIFACRNERRSTAGYKVDGRPRSGLAHETSAVVRQEELAAYLHIRQGQLSKIERGNAAPTIEVLILLSDRFHKSIDSMLRGE